MDFTEPEEHAALRKAVGAIADDFGADTYARLAEQRGSTQALWETLGDHGFVGVNIPEEYGGGGRGLTELAVVCEEVAAHGVPLLLLLVSSAISGEVIARHGSQQQRARWLPGLASGRSKIVFAITESEAGSNSHELATTATRDADHWVLRGSKHYISGVDEADAVLVVARTGGEPGSRRGRLSLFVVDADAAGLERSVIPVSVALPERQYSLHLDSVRVGADRLIGTEGDGFAQVFHGLNPERITGAALCVGIGRYVLKKAAAYANDRDVWGQPHRCPPRSFPPLGQGEGRGRAGSLDDGQGGLAARPRRTGR